MSVTTYAMCPRCGKMQGKQVTTGTNGVVESVRYVKGIKCPEGCVERKANYTPENRRKKK